MCAADLCTDSALAMLTVGEHDMPAFVIVADAADIAQ